MIFKKSICKVVKLRYKVGKLLSDKITNVLRHIDSYNTFPIILSSYADVRVQPVYEVDSSAPQSHILLALLQEFVQFLIHLHPKDEAIFYPGTPSYDIIIHFGTIFQDGNWLFWSEAEENG